MFKKRFQTVLVFVSITVTLYVFFYTLPKNQVAVTSKLHCQEENDDQGKKCQLRCLDKVRSSQSLRMSCCSQRCIPSAVSVNKPPDAPQQCDCRIRHGSGVFEFIHVNMSMHGLHTFAVGCHKY